MRFIKIMFKGAYFSAWCPFIASVYCFDTFHFHSPTTANVHSLYKQRSQHSLAIYFQKNHCCQSWLPFWTVSYINHTIRQKNYLRIRRLPFGNLWAWCQRTERASSTLSTRLLKDPLAILTLIFSIHGHHTRNAIMNLNSTVNKKKKEEIDPCYSSHNGIN